MGGPSPVDVVRHVLETADTGEPETLRECFADGFVAKLANGRVYTGRDAFDLMYRDRFASTPSRWASEFSYEQVDDEVVVVWGGITSDLGERVDGGWLVQVRDGRIISIAYHDTREEARAAVPKSITAAGPAEVIERAIWAFNRRDLSSLVGYLAADFRFTQAPGSPAEEGIAALVTVMMSLREAGNDFMFEPQELKERGHGFVLVIGFVQSDVDGAPQREDRAILARVVDGLATEWVLFPSAEDAEGSLRMRRRPPGTHPAVG
jgi:ketosteroid isomerase-like protein